MTVEVTPLNVLGGNSGIVTRFVDTFNRAGGNLGGNWIQTVSPWTPSLNPVTAATFSVGTCADAQQGMIVSLVGTANPGMTWPSGLLAAPIYMSNFGKSQYSQWQLVRMDRVGANDSFGGPAVLLQNAGQQSTGNEARGLFGYYMLIFASDKSYQLNRGCGSVATNLTSGPAATFTANDVIRLEARIAADLTNVTLTIKKNGATINTFVDNSVGRFFTGSPGWYGQQFDNTGGGSMTNQWRNFDGGLL